MIETVTKKTNSESNDSSNPRNEKWPKMFITASAEKNLNVMSNTITNTIRNNIMKAMVFFIFLFKIFSP